MSAQATIFIPDISGYTEFVTQTELVHASHIINELLEVIVGSNSAGLSVAEVEGDAVLFYRPGEPLAGDALVAQCLEMYEHFHLRLRVIERDAICGCGACRGASNLGLKFVVHHGPVSEIRVAHFTKPAGLELIVAHRLMKNTIGAREYILVTKPFFPWVDGVHAGADPSGDGLRAGGNAHPADSTGAPRTRPPLRWLEGFDEYPAIGRVSYRYASLSSIREKIPAIPPRTVIPFPADDDPAGSGSIEISAPIERVHGVIADIARRPEWVGGLRGVEDEPVADRLGKKHRCVFDDAAIEVTAKSHDARPDRIAYADEVFLPPMNFRYVNHWELSRKRPNLTRIRFTVRTPEGEPLPAEARAWIVPGMQEDLGRLKTLIEAR